MGLHKSKGFFFYLVESGIIVGFDNVHASFRSQRFRDVFICIMFFLHILRYLCIDHGTML